MSTAVMTMAPMPETHSVNFSRSFSSSDLPDLKVVESDKKSIVHEPSSELPRSASITYLPDLKQSANERDSVASSSTDSGIAGIEGNGQQDGSTLQPEKANGHAAPESKADRVGRRKSLVARPKSWIQKVRASPERRASPNRNSEIPVIVPPMPVLPKATREKSKTTSDSSFAAFARRKSWIATSRSPSPPRKPARQQEKQQETIQEAIREDGETLKPDTPGRVERRKSIITGLKSDKSQQDRPKDDKATPPPSRRNTLLLRARSKRPPSLLNSDVRTPYASAPPSAQVSTEMLGERLGESLGTPRTSQTSLEVPPMPKKKFSMEKLQQSFSIDGARRKDDLWSAFRALENDYQKFQSKSSSLKTNVVRTTLLPFLRSHENHPSNKTLRPEDVERRVNIFNKWWTGLLDMLDGHNGNAVSGVDRPVLLDAITMIMSRPEWRLAQSYFAPLSDRQSDSARKSPSSTSLSSNDSQFLAESAYHNARNTFVRNLLTQMVMVVDKMSLRHAPASLVTFCGKATAYAFFFCPGVAEVLVRLWDLPPNTIRRVINEFGIPATASKNATDDISALFPPSLNSLAWTSLRSITTDLKKPPVLPITAKEVNWYGPWITRWLGRDSDLFFVFCKHYIILAEEFMPSDMPLAEKARSPGFVLVHAQILTALDATIHRQATAGPPPMTSFDDVLPGVDATATSAAIILPSSNATRLMAENRLIMLLRDFVSELPATYEDARVTFAHCFSLMTRAMAKKTSMFDHGACFVLCDFMEEAIPIMVRFQLHRQPSPDVVDWHFWFDVCKKMLESHNTTTELRILCFIFSAWSIIVANERRKEILCLGWLVSEDTFETLFNHWCPMVRAHYMRLLCWRLCRYDGEASALDLRIYSAVYDRLRSNWAHYLHLRQKAEKEKVMPPAIVPCRPAPGRALLIIRNDNQSPASAGLFLGFDGNFSGTGNQPTPYRRHSMLPGLAKIEQNENKARSEPPPQSKKKWGGLLSKIMPFSSDEGIENGTLSPSRGSVSPSGKPPSRDDDLNSVRKETANARSRLSMYHSKTSSSSSDLLSPGHRAYAFKFSLEPIPFSHQQVNVRRARPFSPPRLPQEAHSCLLSHVPGLSDQVQPREPKGAAMSGVKYAGRALAEWGLVVSECNGFAERRKSEGVPSLKFIEVPTLGIDSYRKLP